MKTTFKQWMIKQGYTKVNNVWYFNGCVVSGKELSDMLNRFRILI